MSSYPVVRVLLTNNGPVPIANLVPQAHLEYTGERRGQRATSLAVCGKVDDQLLEPSDEAVSLLLHPHSSCTLYYFLKIDATLQYNFAFTAGMIVAAKTDFLLNPKPTTLNPFSFSSLVD